MQCKSPEMYKFLHIRKEMLLITNPCRTSIKASVNFQTQKYEKNLDHFTSHTLPGVHNLLNIWANLVQGKQLQAAKSNQYILFNVHTLISIYHYYCHRSMKHITINNNIIAVNNRDNKFIFSNFEQIYVENCTLYISVFT